MSILKLTLSAEEQQSLRRMRDTAPKAHLRERAAAMLKVGEGQTAKHVALHGLLKVRTEEAVQGWVRNYQQQGIEGLSIKPGRGRKAASPPGAGRLAQKKRRKCVVPKTP